jgi:hypothetical protein
VEKQFFDQMSAKNEVLNKIHFSRVAFKELPKKNKAGWTSFRDFARGLKFCSKALKSSYMSCLKGYKGT